MNLFLWSFLLTFYFLLVSLPLNILTDSSVVFHPHLSSQTLSTTEVVMSASTSGSPSPQVEHVTGNTHNDVYIQAQSDDVSGSSANKDEWSSSPVLYEYKRITPAKQCKGRMSPEENQPSHIWQTSVCQQCSEVSHRMCIQMLGMGKQIKLKETALVEKLCRLADKVKQKIQKCVVEENAQLVMQERGQDVKGLGKKLHQRDVGEIEVVCCPDLQRTECGATHEATLQTMSSELNTQLTAGVKSLTEEKGRGNGSDDRILGKTHEKVQDRSKDARDDKQSATSLADMRREDEQGERSSMVQQGSNEEDPPQMSEQKWSNGAAEEPIRAQGGQPPDEPPEPLADSCSVPCTICNRKFDPSRLEKHVRICQKLSKKRRKPFNSREQRCQILASKGRWWWGYV